MFWLVGYIGQIWGWIKTIFPFVSSVATAGLSVASSAAKTITPEVAQWLMRHIGIIFFLYGFSVFLALATPVLAFSLYHINLSIVLAFSPLITYTTSIIIFFFLNGLGYLLLTFFFYRLYRG